MSSRFCTGSSPADDITVPTRLNALSRLSHRQAEVGSPEASTSAYKLQTQKEFILKSQTQWQFSLSRVFRDPWNLKAASKPTDFQNNRQALGEYLCQEPTNFIQSTGLTLWQESQESLHS